MEPSEKEEIRARTDIVDLISGYTPLKKTGRAYKGLCPFHQEKTPSFTVDPERGRWHCFGACSTGGDVFTFLERAESLTFFEAAERLAERAGVAITRRGGVPGGDEAAARARDEKERLYAINALALRFFRDSFNRAKLARDYAQKRALAHETLENFGVGFAPDDWEALSSFLQRQGANMGDAERAGLVFPSRREAGRFTDKFRGRLIFPILDVQERVVAFGGRLLVPAENAPKYLNSPETPVFSKSRVLYALNRARRAIQEADRVVVVEGYMDAVAAHQAGFPYVVATLGTAVGEEHVRLLGRYTKNVVLSFDADEAGVRAALRAAGLFEAAGGFALRVLALPPGDDPDSLLARGEAARFKKAIDGALTVPEFRLRALHARFDTTSDAGKLAFLREAIPVVAEVTSPLERDVLLRRLAPFHPSFGSGGARAEESLREELQMHRRSGGGGQTSMPNDVPVAPPVRLQGETILEKGGRGGGGRRAPDGRPYRPRDAAYDAPPPTAGDSPGDNAVASVPRFGGAGNRAERTLLRAFLSDDWAHEVRGRLRPEDFSDPTMARLVDALRILVDGHTRPSEALAQLTDTSLVDHAHAALLAGDDEPLGEQNIRDCLRLLEDRKKSAEASQQQSESGDENERLRRYYEIQRLRKHKSAGAEEETL